MWCSAEASQCTKLLIVGNSLDLGASSDFLTLFVHSSWGCAGRQDTRPIFNSLFLGYDKQWLEREGDVASRGPGCHTCSAYTIGLRKKDGAPCICAKSTPKSTLQAAALQPRCLVEEHFAELISLVSPS